MSFGIDQDTITQMLMDMQQMTPDELQGLLDDMEEQSGDLSDGHLVNYAEECVRHTYDTDRSRRDKWDKLWDAHENEIREYAGKEEWQNAIVLNKPFSTVVQAKSIVRRALMERPDYFSVDPIAKDDDEQKLKASFSEKSLKYWLGTRDAALPSVFADATEMGFVVGTSSGIKILWRPDDNGVFRLMLENIAPWHLFADPDRKPRKPQSGLYMIHQDWVALDELYEMQEQGYYENVEQVTTGGHVTDAAGYTVEDNERRHQRRGQIMHRMRYRKFALVTEFWGGILSENGEMIMPNARYTVANGVVIRKPKPVPFARLRWPIVQYAPLPHLLRFDGYGLYEGVLPMWYFQNNLLNIYGDNESWRIQNMYELDPSKLEDAYDREVYPGKVFTRRKGATDGPALNPVLKGESTVRDVQFMWELSNRQWEEGSFVTDPLKGITQEQEQTLGQSEMKLNASQGVFDSIGTDIEGGGVDTIMAVKEVLDTFWDPNDTPAMAQVFGRNSQELAMMQLAGFLMPEARREALAANAEVKVTGISRLIQRSDLIERMKFFIATGDSPRFAMFNKDYDIYKRLADELKMGDLIMSEDDLINTQKQVAIQDAVDSAVRTVDPNHGRQPAKPVKPEPGKAPGQPPRA